MKLQEEANGFSVRNTLRMHKPIFICRENENLWNLRWYKGYNFRTFFNSMSASFPSLGMIYLINLYCFTLTMPFYWYITFQWQKLFSDIFSIPSWSDISYSERCDPHKFGFCNSERTQKIKNDSSVEFLFHCDWFASLWLKTDVESASISSTNDKIPFFWNTCRYSDHPLNFDLMVGWK